LDNSWTGRIDPDEPPDGGRWHQVVRPFGPDASGGVSLIGFAVDEGVRRNQGRVGAAAGPRALRQVLANLPRTSDTALWDAGDINCPEGDLEAAQLRLARLVADCLNQRSLPLVVGGGHEVAWGSFQGLIEACQAAGPLPRLLIVNLDAHFDLRSASQATSGTPFLQMQQALADRGTPFDYAVLGISRFANTRGLFQRARELGVWYELDERLQSAEMDPQVAQRLQEKLDGAQAVYLSICLDVLPAAVAPGVSAPAALGVPLGLIEAVIDQVLGSGKLRLAELAELNPRYDQDDRTARVAARLVARLIAGGEIGAEK